MRRSLRPACVGLTLLALACAPKYAQERKAIDLRVRPSAFDEPHIEMAKSMPPQFSVALSREMPTPGYTFSVDSLDIDPQARRIVARVTQRAPAGMVAQVMTRTWLKLDLGVIDPGRYFLELYVRDDAASKHRPELAALLEAS